MVYGKESDVTCSYALWDPGEVSSKESCQVGLNRIKLGFILHCYK